MRTKRIFASKTASVVALLGLTLSSLIAGQSSATAAPTVTSALSVSSVESGGKVNLTTTMPMVSTTDNSTQEIIQSIDPSKVHLNSTDDVIAPTGWTVTYSQDGANFMATPTNWAAVVKVKATGPINSAGLTVDGKQILSRSVQIPANGSTRTATASSGDGFDVVFDNRGYLFNTYHHNSPSAIDCHKRIDGTSCGAGWPLSIATYGFVSNDRPTNFVDNENNHLWFNNADTGGAGFMCLDISVIASPKPCGGSKATAWHPITPANPNLTGYWTVTMTEANGKLFSWDNYLGNLMCFDYKANGGMGAPCPVLPVTTRVKAGMGDSSQKILSWRGLVFGYQGDAAVCVDSRTLGLCPGWTSGDYKFTANQATIYVEPDAKGNQLGVCYVPSGLCFSETGKQFAGNAFLNQGGVLGLHWYYSNEAQTSGTKVLFSAEWTTNNFWCFDVATNAGCAGWNNGGYAGLQKVPSIYSSKLDPANPNCVWTNGNDGIIRNLDITTSEFGCPSPSPRSTFSGSVLVPRMSCNAEGSVSKYNKFVLTGVVAGTDYKSATLTVLDEAGAPVNSAGKSWLNIPLVVSGNSATADLAGLSIQDAGQNPTFVIDFIDRATITTAVGTISVASEAAQLCLSLTTNVNCPIGLQYVTPADATSAFAAVGATISQAGVRTTYTTANANLTVKAPTAAQCASLVSGSITNGALGPGLVGAVATLYNGTTGAAILGANGQPVTATSDATGAVSFGFLNPGTYKIGFADLPLVAGVGTGDAVTARLCAGLAATCVTTAAVNFTAQNTLLTPAFTTVAGTNQSIEGVYTIPADANADALYVGKDTATSLDVLANDKATTGSTWTLSTIKLCSGTPAVCGTTAVTVDATQGTYSVNTTTGKVVFTPVAGFVGVAKPVTYQITDGTSRTDSAIVGATVLEAPAVTSDSMTGDFRAAISANVTSNDSSAAGTTLDVSSVKLCAAGTTTACAVTSVAVTGQGTYSVAKDGTVTFTPVLHWTGTATSITYSVKDALGAVSYTTVTATVQAVAPVINTTELPNDLVNTTYSYTLSGTAGSAALTATPWTLTGLPTGLSYNAGTGVISGTATVTGTFTVTAQITGTDGRRAVKVYTIRIGAAPQITDPNYPGQNKTYTPYIQIDKVADPYQVGSLAGTFPIPTTGAWSMTGRLPAGMTFNADTGVISGTPTEACVPWTTTPSGVPNITVTVTDSIGLTATHNYELTVIVPAQITTGNLTSVTGIADSETNSATANGGVCNIRWNAIPLNGAWSATGLPAGITINPNSGVMSGTPTTPGIYSPVITVVDDHGAVGTKAITWTVIAPPSVATTTLNKGETGLPIAPITLAATIGTDAIKTTGTAWTVTGLPTGLTLNAATGVISGTPTAAAGNYTLSVTVSDVNGVVSASKTLTLTLVGPSAITTASPLPQATARSAISTIVETYTLATGATLPATGAWSATGLPDGLVINPNTGAITGTPTTGGTYSNIVVSMTDSYGVKTSKTLKLVVVEPPTIIEPSVLGPVVQNVALGATQIGILTVAGTANIATYAIQVPSVLPAGLTLNASTGAITGTPTTVGAYTFSVVVTDAAGLTDIKQFSLYVGTKPSITNTTTPDRIASTTAIDPLSTMVAMAPFAQTATAGSAPLASTGGWSAIGLPAGLIINPDNGTISGTPTAVVANASVVVTLTDSKGLTATKTYTISTIAPPVVTTADPAVMILNTAIATWTQTKTVGTGTILASNAWTATGLPAGLTLNSTSGAVTGTPTAAGEFDVTFTVTDSNGLTGTKVERVIVAGPPTINTAADLGTVAINREIAQLPQVLAQGTGSIPATGAWVVTAPVGGLPAGLWMNPNTGRIMGIPSVAGVQTFTVKVTDKYGLTASKVFTINVVVPPTIITADPLPIVGAGSAMTPLTLAATKGTGNIPTTGTVWTVDPTTPLPTGITLNATTGVLSGTPTIPGLYPLILTVTDSNGVGTSKTFTFPVLTSPKITSATVAAPGVTALPAVGRNIPMNPFTFDALEGSYPIATSAAWSVTAGTLPAGLSLNPVTGVVSGTATTLGTSTFTVKVVDQAGLSASAQFSILVAAAPTIITTSPITPAGVLGAPISATLAATAVAPATIPATGAWKATGLPAGVVINPDTGVISGTPTVGGTFTITATVTDSNGIPASKDLTLLVVAPPTINTPVPATLVKGSLIAPITQLITPGTSSIPLTGAWSYTGTLPAGLIFDPNTGSISGTPTESGNFPITVKVTDSSLASATKSLIISVLDAPVITTATLFKLHVDRFETVNNKVTKGSGTIAATGAWIITGLPEGLFADPDTGAISGTPVEEGDFEVNVTVVDSNGLKDDLTITLNVVTPPSIATSRVLPAITVNTALPAFPQVVVEGTSSLPTTGAWSISAGALPAGMTMNPDTGAISGTPTTPGTYTFTVKVTDSSGASDSAVFTIPVVAAGKNQTVFNLPANVIDGVTTGPTLIPLAGLATSTLKLPVTFTAGASTVCWLDSASMLHIEGTGDCTVTASSGTGTKLSSISQSFKVSKAAQTLSFVAPGATSNGVTAPAATDSANGFKLMGSMSSGLPPAYESLDPTICLVEDDGTVTWMSDLVATPNLNQCRVKVTQPGNANFYPLVNTPENIITVTAKHVTTPAPAPVNPSGAVGAPRTPGTYNLGSQWIITVSKTQLTIKPWSSGKFIGAVTADISIPYTMKVKGKVVKKTQTCKVVFGITKKYAVNDPMAWKSKAFDNAKPCVLNKDAFAYFTSGKPINATAKVTRDRRWPTTMIARKGDNGKGVVIPKDYKNWKLNIG